MSVANPFYQMNLGTYQDADETALNLLDGSLDVENDPVLPLLVKKRSIDAIVVMDSVSTLIWTLGTVCVLKRLYQSGETNDTKPDGLSLLATKAKASVLPAGTINFPTPFPNSTEEFISLGLNARPVFFGCDGASNSEEEFP